MTNYFAKATTQAECDAIVRDATDSQRLDMVAEILATNEQWSADELDAIASLIKASGRSYDQRPVYVVKDVHGCFAIEPEHHGLTLVVWSERSDEAKTFNTIEEAQAHVEQLKQLGFTNVAGVSPV